MQKRQDLSLIVQETEKEQFFRQKCNSLLKLYSSYLLTNYAMDPVLFNNTFTSSIVSEKELHFILLKKFYLTIQRETAYSRTIRTLINEGSLQQLDTLIDEEPNVRRLLIENYISNVGLRNHDAAIQRMRLTSYEQMSDTLVEMKNFYTYKIHDINKALTLKHN